MKRAGRNDPCPCESGLKYKRCCEASDKAGPHLIKEDLTSGLLIARERIETSWDARGKKVRAIGDRIALCQPEETDHEFYLGMAPHEMGKEWWTSEAAKSPDDQHPLLLWWETYRVLRRGELEGFPSSKMGESLYSAEVPGNVRSLLCFGYDLYTLRHQLTLPEPLLNRLRNRDEFQGARYEVAVAAIVARAGYEIEWITDKSRRLPEFWASQGLFKIGVEAKSRSRKGILGKSGDPTSAESVEIDARRLFTKALRKESDGLPLVVALDLNIPENPGESIEDRVQTIHRKIVNRKRAAGERDPLSAALFTNYSWHWDGEEHETHPINVWARSQEAAHPIPWDRWLPITRASDEYGTIPIELP